MSSAYHAALLHRLEHIVGVRRNAKLWAALDDAEREGLGTAMAEIITPSEVRRSCA